MGKAKDIKTLAELAKQMKARVKEQERQRAERQIKSAANDPLDGTVNAFAAKHGDYDRNGRHVVNRGGTAIDRWTRDGQLSDTQQAAILHMRRLWELTETSTRLVANLDRTVFGCPGNGNDAEIEARSDLHRIIDIFRHPLDEYYRIFELVCRFDEPAGTAGSKLANDNRAASTAARTVVCFVADTIYARERLSY